MPKFNLNPLALCLIACCSFAINSCCSDDKQCDAGSPSMGQLPYALNEQLIFKDALGKTIQIRLSNTYTASPSYSIDGKCNSPRKEDNCSASLSIEAVAIIDSNNFIPANQKAFAISLERHELTNQQLTQYSLNAFGLAFVSGTFQNGDISLTQGSLINQYQTPSKTYPVAYAYINSNGFGTSRTVATPTGRLISFTLNSDTSHVFYLVE